MSARYIVVSAAHVESFLTVKDAEACVDKRVVEKKVPHFVARVEGEYRMGAVLVDQADADAVASHKDGEL